MASGSQFGELKKAFQSPKSGKFESNEADHVRSLCYGASGFQSPKSGKFESNSINIKQKGFQMQKFQSPKSGKFESNQFKT